MPDNDQLRDFTDGAAGQMGFGARPDAAYGAEPDDTTDEDEVEEQLQGTDDDDQADAEPTEDGIAAAFWESLSPAEYAGAEASETVRQRLWDAFLAAGGYDLEAGDDGDDADDESDDDFVPQTGADVVAWAQQNEAGLLGAGWESVGDFLVVAASDARWWLETARAQGWPAQARPEQRDLPAGLGMALIAAGIPGARVVRDPLESMFSKESRSSMTRTGRGSVTPRKLRDDE